jgi:hypothetical protein
VNNFVVSSLHVEVPYSSSTVALEMYDDDHSIHTLSINRQLVSHSKYTTLCSALLCICYCTQCMKGTLVLLAGKYDKAQPSFQLHFNKYFHRISPPPIPSFLHKLFKVTAALPHGLSVSVSLACTMIPPSGRWMRVPQPSFPACRC